MIDRLREQIQERLEQLTGEADRLRKALVALDPRSTTSRERKPPAAKPAAPKPPAAKHSASKPRAAKPSTRNPPVAKSTTATEPADSATTLTPAAPTSQPAAPSASRTAPGATKASVLAALADGEALTAGQVATKAGLARATVSTMLSKLAKSGEVQKAERGYRLAPTTSAPPPSPAE